MWHLTACTISVSLSFLNWIKIEMTCFYRISKLIISETSLFKYNEKFTIKNETFQIKIRIVFIWKFSDKNSDSFHISAQNIDYGYSLEPPQRGGSNWYPQSMFLSRNKEKNVYPCKPQFYYIKVGFKEVNSI